MAIEPIVAWDACGAATWCAGATAGSGSQQRGHAAALGVERVRWRAGVVGDGGAEVGPELAAGASIRVVNRLGGVGLEPGCDFADGEVVLVAHPQDAVPLARVVVAAAGDARVAEDGVTDDGFGPGAVEDAGERVALVGQGVEVQGSAGGVAWVAGALFVASGDVADDGVEQGAELTVLWLGAFECAIGLEALDEDILDGVVDRSAELRVTPALPEVAADRSQVAAREHGAGAGVPSRGGVQHGPAGVVWGRGHGAEDSEVRRPRNRRVAAIARPSRLSRDAVSTVPKNPRTIRVTVRPS